MTDPRPRSEPPGEGVGVDKTLRSSDVRKQGEPEAAIAPTFDASPPGAPKTLEIGARLENTYEVKRLLGKGAMGAVYLVEHVGLGKEFAAKVVGASRAMDAGAIARLRNEARITSAIEHENIVSVTHLGQMTDGSVFIVMELLRGEDLRRRLLRQLARAQADGSPGWIPDDEVRAIVEPVLSALSAAHAAGVVHRDLKPDNVFLSETKKGRMRPKVVDFGIGKIQAEPGKDLRLTETGHIVGTPLYMAPEQTRSSSTIDHRADLYAMGIMIFEMMCGRVPFEAANVYEIVIKHATEPPPDPRSVRPDLPGPIADLILRCLEKDPAARFESADAMLAAWTAAWDGVAPGRAPIATADSGDRSEPPPKHPPRAAAVETVSAPAPAMPAPSRPVWLVPALLAGVGLAIGIGYAVSGTPEPAPVVAPPPPPVVAAPPPPPVAVAAPDPEPPPPPTPAASTHTHTIVSDPEGAEVVRDGAVLGHAPFELTLPDGESATIELRMRGRRTATVTVEPGSPPELRERLARTPAGSSGGDFPELAPR